MPPLGREVTFTAFRSAYIKENAPPAAGPEDLARLRRLVHQEWNAMTPAQRVKWMKNHPVEHPGFLRHRNHRVKGGWTKEGLARPNPFRPMFIPNGLLGWPAGWGPQP